MFLYSQKNSSFRIRQILVIDTDGLCYYQDFSPVLNSCHVVKVSKACLCFFQDRL